MKESKLFYAISHLTSIERNRFKKYLQSPYFNSDNNITMLYQLILKNELKINKDSFSKEKLWTAFRKDSPFNNSRFRKYSSDLLKHLEGFLYQEYTRQNKGHEYPFVLDALNERKMDKLYNSVLRSGRDAIKKNENRDSRYFQQVYAIEKRYYEISKENVSRGSAADATDIASALDYFYIIEKLKIHVSQLSDGFFFPKEYSLLLLDEIMDTVEKENLLNVAPIEIFYRLVKSYQNLEDKDNFLKLRKVTNANKNFFEPDDLVEIYSGISNYLIRKINKGDREALKDMKNLVDEIVENEVFNAQGELTPWSFKNAVIAGLRLGEYDWVLKFINENNHRLPADYKNNALSFNYAQVYFYMKEYDKVIKHLQVVEYEDPTYALNSRALLAAVYYEVGEIDPLFSTIGSFKTYLHRQHSLNKNIVSAYLELCTLIGRLTRLRYSDDSGINNLEKYLEENKGIASRQWLMQKLTEIKENKRPW